MSCWNNVLKTTQKMIVIEIGCSSDHPRPITECR